MSRVSYRVPGAVAPPAAPTFRPVDPEAVSTRRSEAKSTVKVSVSKLQSRWLRRFDADGGGPDASDVLRALIDVGMDLELDWDALPGPRALRTAVAESVLVRRRE
jgi:hypothetical protein